MRHDSRPPAPKAGPGANQRGRSDRDPVNILATFTLPERAQAAADDLRAAGFEIVQVDRVPSETPDPLKHGPVVEWGRYGYQPNVLDDKWTAASSWDNASGLIDGESWLVTAVVDAADQSRAEKIIRRHGGRI